MFIIESRDFFISLMELIKITCSLTNKMLALIIMVRQRGPTISEASIQTNKRKGGHITQCVQTNICTGLKRKKPVTTH